MIDWSTISLSDLAGYVSQELKNKGIETILVGGACVTIYSENRYLSYDLDYITYDEMRKVKKALSEIGFIEGKDGYFQHENCPWFVEFVSPPVAVGNEPIEKFNTVKTPFGAIKLLRPADILKDRLAAFYHWKDKQGLEQAIQIYHSQNVDLDEIERWSAQENEMDKFNIFKNKISKS